MTQYQATPDYYRDYIEHGWAKDAAAKVHKYIERWKNAAGKWVYRYKKPESHPDSYNKLQSERLMSSDYRHHQIGARLAYSDRNGILSRGKYITKARQNAKRAFIKKGTGYSGSSSRHKNLTSRGYSGSQGSGESKRVRNTGTRRNYINRDTESNHSSYKRLADAHYRIRKKDKKLASQLLNAYIKNKKNAKVNLYSGNGTTYNNISAYDADRMLTRRGYPSASSWERDMKLNNKATNKSVKKKRKTNTKK